jgi:ribosomal protein S27E
MCIVNGQDTAFYRPRQPWDSPLYRLVEEHYEEFERVYPERFQARHGFWRPVIRKAVFDYLKCGDLREGFARVRCPDCRHEFFVAFSCKQRCICPSCHQKRTLVTSINIADNICARVPHRQFVFAMPKRFRLYFHFNRDLLRRLPRLAWETVLEVCRAVLGRDDVVPGMVAAIQTHGQLSNWHPHIHALTTYGAFTPDGTFITLPDDLANTPFLEAWEAKIFRLLLDEGRITQEVVDQMRSWQHSGFSVDKSVALDAGDTAGLERVAAYMVRCPFSLDRMVSVSEDGKVVCRAEKADCQHFPILGDGKLLRGVSRNFEVFDPLDFLAEVTQHIPDPGMQMVRYYGWYSNKMRGQRAKRAESAMHDGGIVDIDDEDTDYRELCRMRWASLVKRVWEVDPLLCPKCGGTMKVVAFIEKRDQADVIERILKHCGLWDRPSSRAPPEDTGQPVQPVLDLQYVSDDEFLMAL